LRRPFRREFPGRERNGFAAAIAGLPDAPWSAATNTGDAYGYGIFDVDRGQRRGETTITFKYFAIPAVSGETTPLHNGTTTLPTTPFETFVFGRGISGQRGHGHDLAEKPAATTAAT
jgi:hypothetical protein